MERKKTSKVNRLVSLFEISRPKKGLQRTNSLPASKRPLREDNDDNLPFRRSLKSCKEPDSKVHKIKQEIEGRSNKGYRVSTPKPVKKKTHRNKKIDEDVKQIPDRIEDVTEEIQNSDTELEITFKKMIDDDDVFEETYSYLRRLSDTVFNRLSSDTVIECDSELQREDCGDTNKEICPIENVENQSICDENSDSVIEENTEELEGDSVDGANIDEDQETHIEDAAEIEQANPIEWWKNKSFVKITNDNAECSDFSQTRFVKNRSSMRNRSDRRRTGILHKKTSVKELAKQFESFQDAAENGETEKFRRSFIDEMDMEMENMKNDGFKEDFHLSFENLTLLDDFDGQSDLEEAQSPLFQTIIVLRNEEVYGTDHLDQFGETFFDEDLEKGFYYVESYNADGEELIKCSVQMNREFVDFNKFGEIKENASSNIASNDEAKLVLLNDSSEDKSGTDSKRNTIYSTTSGESYEDEGIDIGNNSYKCSARRETICDDQGRVRIERVAHLKIKTNEESVEESLQEPEYVNISYFKEQEDEIPSNDDQNLYESIRLEHEVMFTVPKVKKDRLQYILEEIKSTERKYVLDMEKVLRQYKTFMEKKCPEKVDVIFGNMEQIYHKQVELLFALDEAQTDIQEIVQAFIDFEDLFRLYPRYFKNTPRANAAVKDLNNLIKQIQERMQDKISLSAYLLTPIQRLGKYKLFLENIIKEFEKDGRPYGFVNLALNIIKKYMSKGNDAVAIASILHSPLHTKDYGSFITREKFWLIKPKRIELMVFLFEEAVVFTTDDPKNMEQFIYYQSIKTNDLRIATFEDTTIHLTDYTKTKIGNSSKYTYILDVKNEKLKVLWKQQIEDILWKQMEKLKENTLKKYQNGEKLPRNPERSKAHRSKSTGSSTFYVD